MKRSSTAGKVFTIIGVFLILALAGSTTYLFLENKDLKDQASLTTEEQNRRLVEEINKVFDLPDEEPVVAIVTDVDEFKKQYGVFDNAETGDYLLFFRKARLNVLYRQSEKRVVKTADVIVPISVELFGSEEAIAQAEAKLSEFGDQVSITKSVTEGITQAFLFDVDGDQTDEAKSIADQIEVEIGATLPASIQPAEQTEVVIAVIADTEKANDSQRP